MGQWLEVCISACNAEDMGSIPGLEDSPGGGNDNSLQYSCLGNHMDRGAWWTMGLQRSQTNLVTKQHFHRKKIIYIYIEFFSYLYYKGILYLYSILNLYSIIYI